MDRGEIVALLWFWEQLKDERLEGDGASASHQEILASVESMAPDALARFAEIARRQGAQQEDARASVANRATSLLVFVGIVSAGAAIVGASFDSSWPGVWIAAIIVGLALLYALVAVAWLAVGAAGVAMWTGVVLSPDEGRTLHGQLVTEATDLTFAFRQNKGVLRNLTAYLADAQTWARTAVVLLALLASVSVAAAATKPATLTATQGGSVGATSAAPTLVPGTTTAPAPSASAPSPAFTRP